MVLMGRSRPPDDRMPEVICAMTDPDEGRSVLADTTE